MIVNKLYIYKLVSLGYPIIVFYNPLNPDVSLHIFIESSFKGDLAADKYTIRGYDITELTKLESISVQTGVSESEKLLRTKIDNMPIVEMDFAKNYAFHRYAKIIQS